MMPQSISFFFHKHANKASIPHYNYRLRRNYQHMRFVLHHHLAQATYGLDFK